MLTTKNVMDKVKIDVEHGARKIPENMEKMNPWTVTLRFKGKQWTLPFFTGYGRKGEPTAKDVVSCLLADASSYDSSRDFEDFCANLGYEAEVFDDETGRVRKNKLASSIYDSCRKTAERLPDFFSEDLKQVEIEMQDY